MSHKDEPFALPDGTKYRTTDERSVAMQGNGVERRKRFDVNRYVVAVVEGFETRLPFQDEDDIGAGLHVDPVVARACLASVTEFKQRLEAFQRVLEGIAAEYPGQLCEPCGKRFYPSRSDAKYCSGTCRLRAHRAKS